MYVTTTIIGGEVSPTDGSVWIQKLAPFLSVYAIHHLILHIDWYAY